MEIDREKINIALARKCWKVSDLALAYGCTRQRMNILLNSRNVSTATAGRIANALEVDVTEILEERG